MSKMRWNTVELKKLLESPDWRIKAWPSHEDVETESLELVAVGAGNDQCISICGFNWDGTPIANDYDCDVDAVQVTDGQDSAGGLNSSDEPTCVMYGRVVSRLRKAGWTVVPSLQDYF